MFKKILDYLDEIDMPYSTNESDGIVTFLTRMDNASFHCVVELKESVNLLVFYSTIGVVIPERKRVSIAELITRINYDLLIGNFEMDFNDGEVRYKTSIDYENIDLSSIVLANLISVNLSIIDDYFYAIIEGIMSDLSPEAILEKKESTEAALNASADDDN